MKKDAHETATHQPSTSAPMDDASINDGHGLHHPTRRGLILGAGVLSTLGCSLLRATAHPHQPHHPPGLDRGKPRTNNDKRYFPANSNVTGAALRVRMPRWLADECFDQRTDAINPGQGKEPTITFPDEIIFKENGKFRPFEPGELELPPRQTVPGTPVSDDPPTTLEIENNPNLNFKDAYGKLYERWTRTVGNRFENRSTLFDNYLKNLLGHISRLNAAKYWLRLCHLKKTSAYNRTQWEALPTIPTVPGNPEKEPVTIYDWDDGEWKDGVVAAEKELAKFANALRKHIQDGVHQANPKLDVSVDPIMSNDYIVGIRVVADKTLVRFDGNNRTKEWGGSSSSYVRVSSPFSSNPA